MKAIAVAAVAVSLVTLGACSGRPARKALGGPNAASAAGGPASGGQAPAIIPAVPLTETEAEARFRQIAKVAYELRFGLEEPAQGENRYEGAVTIRFELRPKAEESGKGLFVDFRGGPQGSIQSISLNGAPVADAASRYDGNRIHFRVRELHPGMNEIRIGFSRAYGTNSTGLYRFKDPEDGKVYLYTDDEPNSAHQVFPCFDQPDLKATYSLTVDAPSAWVVVSNTLETGAQLQQDRRIWTFPATQPLSSYLFALIAGNYVSWKSVAKTGAGDVPIRLFARASLKRYLDRPENAREWLDITSRGLDFYSTRFGHPYPFGKYDQILVPDFDEGAMENAGAVTFAEDYAFRTRKTRLAHMDRADTILHEMAHMWFGDLVTMKWWNGLWLNESFATFMSAWSVADATKYKESWQSFLESDKSWAYWQDQLVTTHPIDLPVPDTDQAFANFDGITYGKGASVLKQLRFYLGQDDFIEGIQRYFDQFAYGNTTLRDFIQMLSEASDQDLKAWEALWLMTPGANTVQARWACSPDARGMNRISSFELDQGNSPESHYLRPHKTQVALFGDKDGHLVARDLIPVSYQAAETQVGEAIGKPCPAFVYPNYGDEDYVLVRPDPVSLERMTRNLRRIEDPLTRQMYWEDLWNLVEQGEFSPKRYVEKALESLGSENDLLVIDGILENVSQSRLSRDSAMKFIPPDERAPLQNRLEKVLMRRLLAAKPGSDLQLACFNAFVDAARTTRGLELVRALLSRKQHLPGLRIDQDVRWSLVTALARNGAPDAQKRIEAESGADPSHFGRLKRLAALAQIPTDENKAQWFAKIAAAGEAGGSSAELSSSELREVMSNLSILGQEKQVAPLLGKYFAFLPKAARLADVEFVSNYTRSLYPGICDQALVDLTSRALSDGAASSYRAEALKQLKTHLQEEQRCIRARGEAQ